MTEKKARKQARKKATLSPLMWPIITPKNRKEFAAKFKQEWIQRNEKDGNPDKHSAEEIEEISTIVGNFEVKKIIKGTKLYYTKGVKAFRFHGQMVQVETQQLMQDRIDFMQAQREHEAKQKAKLELNQEEE